MDHSDQEIDQAEELVAERCEAAVATFLDTCASHPGRPVTWESNVDPWSFRVVFDGDKWIMADIDLEVEGLEDLFEGEDLQSRDGVDHVICSVLIPLAMEAALGEIPERTAEGFLTDMEASVPKVEEP